jgi:hypothetical protein
VNAYKAHLLETGKSASVVNQSLCAIRKSTSTRNTQVIAALQYIGICGECGKAFTTGKQNYMNYKLKDGTPRHVLRDIPRHFYRCGNSIKEERDKHEKLWHHGPTIDKKIWRFLVDNAIKHPEIIQGQVIARQAELQNQGDDLEGEIARIERKLRELDAGRDRLALQLTKGNIIEKDFERVMVQVNTEKEDAQEELAQLRVLRDDQQAVLDGLNIAYQVLANYERRLPELDISDKEFRKLGPDQKKYILEERKAIIRALCLKVTFYPDGDFDIEGLINIDSNQKFCDTNYSLRVKGTNRTPPQL